MRGWKTPGRYRWRTTARMYLPWWLIDLGVASKGKRDCGNHEWYLAEDVPGPHEDSESGKLLRCYHCTTELVVSEETWLRVVVQEEEWGMEDGVSDHPAGCFYGSFAEAYPDTWHIPYGVKCELDHGKNPIYIEAPGTG